MCIQSLRCLKSKYLLFFSAQQVSRYLGINVESSQYSRMFETRTWHMMSLEFVNSTYGKPGTTSILSGGVSQSIPYKCSLILAIAPTLMTDHAKSITWPISKLGFRYKLVILLYESNMFDKILMLTTSVRRGYSFRKG